MAKKLRLTEGDLRKIVKSSVMKILREGTSDNTAIDNWETIKDALGADTMLDALFNWASSDEIDRWIGWFDEEYGLGLTEDEFEEEDDFEDEDYDDIEL